MKANINGVVLIIALLISICSGINIGNIRRDYYNSAESTEEQPLFLAEKKSGIETEAYESSSWFLIDDVFYWVYCRIYPTCYKRPRLTKQQKEEEERVALFKKKDAEAKKAKPVNNTQNVTKPPADQWPNFFKGRSYIRDDTNKTDPEEEEDDEDNKPDEDKNGETEVEKMQKTADDDAQRRYDKQHKDVSDTSKVATGHKQLENAKDEEDVTKKGERNKPEHEDPIVKMEDIPGGPSNIQKTRGKGKHVIKRRKNPQAKTKKLEQTKEGQPKNDRTRDNHNNVDGMIGGAPDKSEAKQITHKIDKGQETTPHEDKGPAISSSAPLPAPKPPVAEAKQEIKPVVAPAPTPVNATAPAPVLKKDNNHTAQEAKNISSPSVAPAQEFKKENTTSSKNHTMTAPEPVDVSKASSGVPATSPKPPADMASNSTNSTKTIAPTTAPPILKVDNPAQQQQNGNSTAAAK